MTLHLAAHDGAEVLRAAFDESVLVPTPPAAQVPSPHPGVTLTQANLIGAVSTLFWALMRVLLLKYLILIRRA